MDKNKGKHANSISAKIREHLKTCPTHDTSYIAELFDCSSPLVSKIKSEMLVNCVPTSRDLAARARGITVMQLDMRILKTVYNEDMIDAILDDME